LQKILTTFCEETREGYEPNRTFVTSDTAVKIAYICKLLRLLPDRGIVRLIMELVGNRSFTLTSANGKRNRLLHFKIGVPQGSGLAPPCTPLTSSQTSNLLSFVAKEPHCL